MLRDILLVLALAHHLKFYQLLYLTEVWRRSLATIQAVFILDKYVGRGLILRVYATSEIVMAGTSEEVAEHPPRCWHTVAGLPCHPADSDQSKCPGMIHDPRINLF